MVETTGLDSSKEKAKKYWRNFLIENISNISTVIFLIFVTIFHISRMEERTDSHTIESQVSLFLSDVVPAFLGFLIVYIGYNIYRSKKSQDRADEMEKILQEIRNDRRFFQGESKVDETKRKILETDEDELWLSGVTFKENFRHYEEIKSALIRGKRVRAIVVSEDMAIELADRAGRDDWVKWNTNLREAKGKLEQLCEWCNTKNIDGDLEVGYLPFLPSFAVTAEVSIGKFSKENDDNVRIRRALVKIYHHDDVENPYFVVDSKEKKWAERYKQQYDLLWRKCMIRVFASKNEYVKESIEKERFDKGEMLGKIKKKITKRNDGHNGDPILIVIDEIEKNDKRTKAMRTTRDIREGKEKKEELKNTDGSPIKVIPE